MKWAFLITPPLILNNLPTQDCSFTYAEPRASFKKRSDSLVAVDVVDLEAVAVLDTVPLHNLEKNADI